VRRTTSGLTRASFEGKASRRPSRRNLLKSQAGLVGVYYAEPRLVMVRVLFAFTLMTAIGGVAEADVRATTVEVVSADGTVLKASYYSPDKAGPAMVLLHQCDMTRASWESLGSALAARGVHVLAIDYRGYGDNRSVNADYSQLPADVDAALAKLKTMSGVDQTRIAAGGASCGVDHAVQLARRSGQIKALVLLSGPTSDAGKTYLQTSKIPVFFAFSADEGARCP
jgi:pimeloyl-ACP methyl ester carboxylesterase